MFGCFHFWDCKYHNLLWLSALKHIRGMVNGCIVFSYSPVVTHQFLQSGEVKLIIRNNSNSWIQKIKKWQSSLCKLDSLTEQLWIKQSRCNYFAHYQDKIQQLWISNVRPLCYIPIPNFITSNYSLSPKLWISWYHQQAPPKTAPWKETTSKLMTLQ